MAKKSVKRCAPEELLGGLSPQIHELVTQLRQLVRTVVPAVEEAGYPGWKLIGYRHRRYFCFIAPKIDRVQLGFEHGRTLPDPTGLLEGTGKQVRYVMLQPEQDLPFASLKELIEIAALRAEIEQTLASNLYQEG